MDQLTSLMLRASDGEREALADVVRRTQADVWRLCAYLTSPDDADDLTQETYARMCAGLQRITPETDGRAWLLGIARHVAVDHVRRAVRWRRLVLPRPRPTSPDDTGATDLMALVQALDPDHRAAFVMTQLLGLSYEEAAEACGCPIGTIRSRVARARTELAHQVSESGQAPRRRAGGDGLRG